MADQNNQVFEVKTKTFEEMIESLKTNRMNLNQSNSFEEISHLWQEIRKTYLECSKIIQDITQELTLLEGKENIGNCDENLKFSEALKNLEELAQKSKTVSITEIPALIMQMQTLKMFCFNKLNQEKLKMEEIE